MHIATFNFLNVTLYRILNMLTTIIKNVFLIKHTNQKNLPRRFTKVTYLTYTGLINHIANGVFCNYEVTSSYQR